MHHKPLFESPADHRGGPRLQDSEGPHSGEGAASALASLKKRLELLSNGPRRPVAPHGDRRS